MRYTCLFICYAKCRQLQVQVQRQQRKQKLQLLLLQRRLQQRSWQQVSQSVSQSIKKVRLRRRRYASTRVPNKMQLKTKTKKPVQADGVMKVSREWTWRSGDGRLFQSRRQPQRTGGHRVMAWYVALPKNMDSRAAAMYILWHCDRARRGGSEACSGGRCARRRDEVGQITWCVSVQAMMQKLAYAPFYIYSVVCSSDSWHLLNTFVCVCVCIYCAKFRHLHVQVQLHHRHHQWRQLVLQRRLLQHPWQQVCKNLSIPHFTLIIRRRTMTIFIVLSFPVPAISESSKKFGSSGRKSVSARWPPTRLPSCKLDL